jgi:hypothetical protein
MLQPDFLAKMLQCSKNVVAELVLDGAQSGVKSRASLEADADKEETGFGVSLGLRYVRSDENAEAVVKLIEFGHSIQVKSEVEPTCSVNDQALDCEFVSINVD